MNSSQSNFYYPLFIDLRDRTVAVIGGGAVACRKVEGLRKTGARIKVVSPEVIDDISRYGDVEILQRNYIPEDLEGASLVIAATDDEATNIAVSRDALSRNIFCNVVDQPELCSFIVPSVIEKGPIKIAVSTGGVSPTLSKKLRFELDKFLGPEYATLALVMGKIRPLVISGEGGFERHKMIFDVLINSELIDAIREQDRSYAEEILYDALGVHIDLSELIP